MRLDVEWLTRGVHFLGWIYTQPIPITERKEEKTPHFNEIQHNFFSFLGFVHD